MILSALASISCGDDTPTTPPVPVLTTIAVTLPAAAIQTGETSTPTVAGLDQNGVAILLPAVTWTTASAAIATVNASGVVTGVAAGTTQVIVEGNGIIYAYAIDHTASTVKRIASFTSGNPGVMGLEYDRESGYLWSWCDDTCGNKAQILTINQATGATLGRFLPPREFARPSTLLNVNNEGFAFTPNAECVGGRKPVFWADDNETAGHSIRSTTIQCGVVAAKVPVVPVRP